MHLKVSMTQRSQTDNEGERGKISSEDKGIPVLVIKVTEENLKSPKTNRLAGRKDKQTCREEKPTPDR